MQKRNSNIELLRIIVMLLIIASHLSLHGIINNDLYWKTNVMFNRFLAASLILGNIGVGCFFVITGYFSTNKKNSFPVSVVVDILFYSLLNMLLLIFMKKEIVILENWNNKEWMKAILKLFIAPITGDNWWFATTFIYLSIFIVPVLEKVFKHVKSKDLIYIVVFCLIAMIFSEILGTVANRVFQATAYYILGRMIRENEISLKKISLKKCILFLIGFLIVHSVMNYICYSSSSGLFGTIADIVIKLIICPSIVFFIFLVFIKKKKICNPMINKIAETIFGIYLLHDSRYTRSLLWGKLVPMNKIYLSNYFFIWVPIVVIGIFLIAVIVNSLYVVLLKKRVVQFIFHAKEKYRIL